MAGAGRLLSGQRGEGVFDPPPAGTSWTEQASWADRQLTLLHPQYEGRWDIWYVPVHPAGCHWCARPAGTRLSTITVGTPEDLVAEIRRQEESPARGRDFGDLPAGELERVHRDLTGSAALAVPSSGAYLMAVTQLQAIDTELAARRRAAGGQSKGVLLMGQAGRSVSDVDQEVALAVLELAWAGAGYHGFGVDDGLWSAISSAGDLLTGDTPDALTARIGAHWQAMQ